MNLSVYNFESYDAHYALFQAPTMLTLCQRSQEKMKSQSQFAIQKSKRADSQAQRIGENNFNSKVLRP